MRIMSRDELLSLLEWASAGDPLAPVPKGLDPPVDNPERYGRSDPTYRPPPLAVPHTEMVDTHFYYVGMVNVSGSKKLRTVVYHKQPTPAVPEADIVSWIADARKSAGAAEYRSFAAVQWRRPGFLVFFIDLPGWDFLEAVTASGGKENRALYFAEIKNAYGVSVSHPNHSFFNARTLTLSGPQQAGQPAESYKLLVVDNYNLKAPDPNGSNKYRPRDQNDKHDPDDYKFDIFLTLAIENGAADDVFPIVLDPGGKNVGPP